MTRDERWQQQYDQVMEFMNKMRNPPHTHSLSGALKSPGK